MNTPQRCNNIFPFLQAVGLVQGLSGVATVACALPVGIYSDKMQRHHIARFSASLDALGIITSVTAVLINTWVKFHLFLVAAVLWGMSSACDSSLDALFADSIPTGNRSQQFTQMLAISRACLGAGPLVSACIFHFHGALRPLLYGFLSQHQTCALQGHLARLQP
jgi:MFS family permease